MLRQKQLEVLQNVYEDRDVVVWFPTGYGKSVCYQLLPYMVDVKFSRANAPPIPSKRTKPRTTWTSYIYSAFFIRILIYAFTVCYKVRYPDHLAHVHKYTYSKYQASLLYFGGLGSRLGLIAFNNLHATLKIRDVGTGLQKIVSCSQPYLAVPLVLQFLARCHPYILLHTCYVL